VRRQLGDEHPDTLASMSGVAFLYMLQGRYTKAESLCIRTFETRRRVLGEERPDTLNSMNNLALLYRNESKYAEAEPIYLKLLQIQARTLGQEHPKRLGSMNDLAFSLPVRAEVSGSGNPAPRSTRWSSKGQHR
jgi:hypothetical protein